jgi:hypothetical protein
MRLVCGKHIMKEILRPWSFFDLLSRDDPKHRFTVIETIAKVVDAWTPPTLENLSDAVINKWVNELKMEALIALYMVFGADTKGEAAIAARLWS